MATADRRIAEGAWRRFLKVTSPKEAPPVVETFSFFANPLGVRRPIAPPAEKKKEEKIGAPAATSRSASLRRTCVPGAMWRGASRGAWACVCGHVCGHVYGHVCQALGLAGHVPPRHGMQEPNKGHRRE